MRPKYLIKIVCFLAIFAVAWGYFNRVFISEHQFQNSAASFRDIAEQSDIDVLFIGSSHVFTSTIPSVIDEKTKAISYNLGTDGLRLELSSVVLEEALKHTKPKVVAVEVFRGSVAAIETDKSRGFQLRALDFASNTSGRKLKMAREIYEFNELTGVYSPLLRNHSNWNQAKFFSLDRQKKFNPANNLFDHGYIGSFIAVKDSTKEKYKDFRTTPQKTRKAPSFFKEIHHEEFKYLAGLAEKFGFELFLYTAPDLRFPWVNGQLFDEIQSVADTYGFKYLNQNLYFDELDLKTTDFKDASHLNFYGALKSSALLGEFIAENFELPDRSDTELWQSKQQDFTALAKQNTAEHVLLEGDTSYELTEEMVLEYFELTKVQSGYSVRFNFLNPPQEAAGKYKLGIQLYPAQGAEDQLTELSKSKGRKYDNYSIRLDVFNNDFEERLRTTIKDLGRVRLFLYDMDGYKGIIGKPQVISDFKL